MSSVLDLTYLIAYLIAYLIQFGGSGLDILQQKTELKTPYGHVEVVALRPSDEKLPTVLVNVGCYYTLADPWGENGRNLNALFGLIWDGSSKQNGAFDSFLTHF